MGWIRKELDINKNSAQSILKRAEKNGVIEEDIRKRVLYVSNYQDEVKNVTGLAVSLMDNKKWSESKEAAGGFNAFRQSGMSGETAESEKILSEEINS